MIAGRSAARARARGVSTVEYMIILGVVALGTLGAYTAFAGEAQGVAAREGECVRTFSCADGASSSSGGMPSGHGVADDAPAPAAAAPAPAAPAPAAPPPAPAPAPAAPASAPSDGRSASGRYGDNRVGTDGLWQDMNDMQPGLLDKLDTLSRIDNGTLHADPASRLGAYEATRGYPPGTVGNAVHTSIGGIYGAMGTFGEERIGTVFNSPEAKALYGQPVSGPASLEMATIEHRYWSNVRAEDAWSAGGNMGSAFTPGVRDAIQKGAGAFNGMMR